MENSEDLELNPSDNLASQQPRDQRRERAIPLRPVVAIALFLLWGGLLIDLFLVPEKRSLAAALFLWRILYPLLVMAWCLFDGRVQKKEATTAGLIGIFVAPPLGFIIYCFWSRGARGFLPILLALIPIVAVVVVLGLRGELAPGL